MRKVVLLMLSLAFCLAVVSCGAGKTDDTAGANKEQQVANDTVIAEVAEVEEEVVVDVEPFFITPDLAFMEVHGHVKSVEYMNGRKAVFDEEGNLVDYATEYSGDNEVYIGRDDDGYIVSTYDGPGGSEMFDYDKEKMRLVLTAAGDGAYYSECNIKYDENGNVFRYSFLSENMAEETSDEWYADVEIVAKDDQGNWTELKSEDVTVKRTIVYY
ncbi:MAG: hypothetical protein J6T48_02735 [Bacteroidales bacterium]|nr:hypothetical protein [Bacteroidales bacterium]